MDNTEDLRLLLGSRHPLVIVEMRDERRFMEILRRAAASLQIPVWTWSIARGLARDGHAPQYTTTDANKALAFIEELDGPGVFVFADAHPALEDAAFVRRVKELAQAPHPGRTLVLTTAQKIASPELDGLALRWTLKPPTQAELKALVHRTLDDLATRRFPVALDAAATDQLVGALRGLTVAEAERLIQQAAFRDGAVSDDDIAYIRTAKAEMLEADGALELVEADVGSLDDVGGLDRLKQWLSVRGRALDPGAQSFGLDPPRGVLVTGVPGCGKSMVAKTLARSWGMPLVLLDPARLYGRFVGESEERLDRSLQTVGAMAPAVLWVDEIEKGFASGTADGGVSTRILGTFLRWMQDRPPGVFLIATANDVRALPPEFLRKGRFDEIFFVDLPGRDDRAAIVATHLRRRGRDPQSFDVDALADATDGFSGAEIEAVVVAALYRAFGAERELTTEDLLVEAAGTVPLSRTRAEEVAALRAWASERAMRA